MWFSAVPERLDSNEYGDGCRSGRGGDADKHCDYDGGGACIYSDHHKDDDVDVDVGSCRGDEDTDSGRNADSDVHNFLPGPLSSDPHGNHNNDVDTPYASCNREHKYRHC